MSTQEPHVTPEVPETPDDPVQTPPDAPEVGESPAVTEPLNKPH